MSRLKYDHDLRSRLPTLSVSPTGSKLPLLTMLDAIQRVLDFKGHLNPQFSNKYGLGRIGVAAFGTGLVFGVHATVAACCFVVNGLALSLIVSVTTGSFEAFDGCRVNDTHWLIFDRCPQVVPT